MMIDKVEKSNINVSVNGIIVEDNDAEAMSLKHSEDMHDIITAVPNWIVQWGIMIFFGILLIAVAIAVLVRYPDTIKTGLKVESINKSQSVFTTQAGIISKLLVHGNDEVKKGQPLALINQTADMKKTLILTAPINGKIAFISILQEGYYLKANQEIFRIAPSVESFFGILQISQNQINKIKNGQKVLVNLANYPVDEFGYINGKISYITDEPTREGTFFVKVSFDKNLKKTIKLKDWMTGSAEIITEDVSVISRIYASISKGLK